MGVVSSEILFNRGGILFNPGDVVIFTKKALSCDQCVGSEGCYYRVVSVEKVDPRFLKGNGHHPQRLVIGRVKKNKRGVLVYTKSASVNVSGVLVEHAVME